jgi:hypothetical protein
MAEALESRVERVLAGLVQANARLVARLESVSEVEASQPPPTIRHSAQMQRALDR